MRKKEELFRFFYAFFKIIIVITVALVTSLKGFVRGLELLEIGRRMETIQSSHRILSYVLAIWETCCLSNSSESPPADDDMKNSPSLKYMGDNIDRL